MTELQKLTSYLKEYSLLPPEKKEPYQKSIDGIKHKIKGNLKELKDKLRIVENNIENLERGKKY